MVMDKKSKLPDLPSLVSGAKSVIAERIWKLGLPIFQMDRAEIRETRSTVRFTKGEHERIYEYAKRCEMPVSSYIREVALRHKPRGKDLTHAINQLSRQGGLLKHLHKEGLGYGKETANLLSEMGKTTKLLASLARSEQEKEEIDGVNADDSQNSKEEERRKK